MLYSPAYDHVFFVTRFLYGLRDEIRSVIALHRPQDVETAVALARLQETELEAVKTRSTHKFDSGGLSKQAVKTGFPVDKNKPRSDTKQADAPKQQEKLDFLRSFRKEKGLHFKCGEKWNRQHKCPQQVPLHIIEELLEALDCSDDDSDDLNQPMDSSMMAVSGSTTASPLKRRTMQLQGFMGKQEVLILVDSGSITSFISEQLVQQLQLPVQHIASEKYTVADGGSVSCSGVVTGLQWWTQGHSFTQDIRVLPLGSFDIILGADWLEDHSPMWIHWRHKKMRFVHNGKRILLQGLKPDQVVCRAIAGHKLKGLLRRKAITHVVQLHKKSAPDQEVAHIASISEPAPQMGIPHEIQTVLDKFPHVFQETTTLPPQRTCDHTIDLVPGAQPINSRAYRLPPDQKDKVEKQLKEMLQKRLIRHSASPFASPVLLVKKRMDHGGFASTTAS